MSVDAAAQISKFNFGGPGHIDRSLHPALQDQTPDHQIQFEWDTSYLAIKITNINMANDAIIRIILPYENCGLNVQMFKSSYRIETNQVYNDITLTVSPLSVSCRNHVTDSKARRPSRSCLTLAMQRINKLQTLSGPSFEM